LSTNSTIAHFGLGNAKQIDSITVTWPISVSNGFEERFPTELINVPVNQLIVVIEETP
jgi:hypothetical protein